MEGNGSEPEHGRVAALRESELCLFRWLLDRCDGVVLQHGCVSDRCDGVVLQLGCVSYRCDVVVLLHGYVSDRCDGGGAVSQVSAKQV